ncbi:hypothetical protein ACHAXA_005321 [Cyclostephanos tholiformis]|uniref:Golgi SNAP receptor complex member 2 n=1 Tax=Cyclostephanos tholiformis TaxID=382380 RepID=A0ABD3RA63_9STRA
MTKSGYWFLSHSLAIIQGSSINIKSTRIAIFAGLMTSIVELFPKSRKLGKCPPRCLHYPDCPASSSLFFVCLSRRRCLRVSFPPKLLAYDSRQHLSQVQNGLICPSELFLSLDELSRQLDLMENLAQRETPAQREIWKRKILELREDGQSIRRQGEHYDRMASAGVRRRRERDELLLARRRDNRRMGGGDDDDEMQQLTEEADSLANSRGMMNELLATGANTLTGLVGQRSRMRWVNRKMLDIGNKIGLSNSTMRMIERRDATDAYLVFGGMVVTMLVIYFLYF